MSVVLRQRDRIMKQYDLKTTEEFEDWAIERFDLPIEVGLRSMAGESHVQTGTVAFPPSPFLQEAWETDQPQAAMLAHMSVECTKSENGFILRGIEGYPYDLVLEWAHPGWSARPIAESGPATRDSALTRTRAVERLLRHSVVDEVQLAAIMVDVDRALDACPE